MYTREWQTSPRAHGVIVDHDVRIPVGGDLELAAVVFRPATPGAFPALLGVHAYDSAIMSTPAMPIAMGPTNGNAEAGDPTFYARRGYAHVLVNVRGTGHSGGRYSNYAPREAEDIAEAIRWLAEQPWCNGRVGMFGASYFAVAAKQVAALAPEPLQAIYSPYGYTDFYRDKFYHGGILAKGFLLAWSRGIDRLRAQSWSRDELPDGEYDHRLAAAREDPEVASDPVLAKALAAPDDGPNPLLVDILINQFDGPYWQQRNPVLENVTAATMLGGDWSMFGLHLPGDVRSWEHIRAPKRMILGPRLYLDRPLYQHAYESLRWFDQWLKDEDTGSMDEPPVRVFVPGLRGGWRGIDDWPPPEARWHPFMLHGGGLLSEHESWPNEGATSFEDTTYGERGGIEFATPPFAEPTEVVGPPLLTIFGTTSASEVLWFASLWAVRADDTRQLMTRGWLRGSMREETPAANPWEVERPFQRREPLVPGEAYEFRIPLSPAAYSFDLGDRLVLRISCSDVEPPTSSLDFIGAGHLLRKAPSWVSVLHDENHPSRLDLPITSGNVIGTFMSGGINDARPTF
jgi:predicted acyl esterase